MRIDRIRLKNFAGVIAAEVRFAPTGVTIVHGANEAGKSTLMQAINVLIDHRDDSRKEDVRNCKPVHRDVGAEVEADIEVGKYRFTYFKRFHKDRETTLTIHAPDADSLVGREAHERVQQMLASSVDTMLWQALRIAQGQNLEMPQLHDQPALAQALDRVAGQAKSGEKEEALFDAVVAEHRKYYTDGGKEKDDPLGRTRTAALQADARVADLQTQLSAVEDDVNAFASLQLSTATQRRGVEALETALAKAQEDWDDVARLVADAERAAAAQQLAVIAAQAAGGDAQRRNALIDAVRAAQEQVRKATGLQADAAGALEAATQRLTSARLTWEAARTAASARDADANVRQQDLKYRDEEFGLKLLEERLAHVRDADAEAASASAVVSDARITAKLRAQIRAAELAFKTAQGILNVASPRLTITALNPLTLMLDGSRHLLAAGEDHVMSVSESLSAQIADVARVRVEPGTSAESLRHDVQLALDALARDCASAGVATPEAAETAWAALEDAKRAMANRDRIANQHLRDLSRERLAQLITTTQAAVAAYNANRVSALPLPATAEEAKTAYALSTRNSADARRALGEAEAALAPLRDNHGQCAEDHAAKAALLQRAQQDTEQLLRQLESARHTSSDDVLAEVLRSAEQSVLRVSAEVKTAGDALGARDPDSIRAVLDSAGPALKNAREQFEQQERKLVELRARLELIGDKGLAEALADAERSAFEARDTLDRLLRRANAARMLYETLDAARAAMRKAYVAPLREGIERLGRLVFGPTLRVEVDDRLQVVRRTLDGVTVGLDQLSTGAREQMGLLVRLAAATMVSVDGGVPLVLDDALGSTDEVRAQAIGTVLRIASKDMQTIILTCSPERYVHAGAVATVSM